MDMSRYYRPNKVGGTIMWCAFCEEWFDYDERWDGTCPRCGLNIDSFKCSRCGRVWKPKHGGIPELCPRCKSPYWNRERMRDPLTGQWYEGYGPKAVAERKRKELEELRRRGEHD